MSINLEFFVFLVGYNTIDIFTTRIQFNTTHNFIPYAHKCIPDLMFTNFLETLKNSSSTQWEKNISTHKLMEEKTTLTQIYIGTCIYKEKEALGLKPILLG